MDKDTTLKDYFKNEMSATGNYHKGLDIREGNLPDINPSKTITIAGDVDVPFDFVDPDKGGHEKKSFSYARMVEHDKSINLFFNQVDKTKDQFFIGDFEYHVIGKIHKEKWIDILNLNTMKYIPVTDMAMLLKGQPHLFKDPDSHAETVVSLRKVDAEITQKIEDNNDLKGNKKKMVKQSLITKTPLEFTLRVAPFVGFPKEDIKVEVLLDVHNFELVASLFSSHFKLMEENIWEMFKTKAVKHFQEERKIIVVNQ